MDLFRQYFVPWVISNTGALLLLITVFWKTKITRALFSLLFGWACWMNYSTAHHNPEDYLSYAVLTPFGIYRDFINGWFRENIITMVTLISFGQGLIALGMLLNGWPVQLACIGAIVFLMAIAPLGIGSAFPFSITASIAAGLIIRKDDFSYLWNFKK